jgi:hypothetical protein
MLWLCSITVGALLPEEKGWIRRRSGRASAGAWCVTGSMKCSRRFDHPVLGVSLSQKVTALSAEKKELQAIVERDTVSCKLLYAVARSRYS